jgi:hypothetical protein
MTAKTKRRRSKRIDELARRKLVLDESDSVAVLRALLAFGALWRLADVD